MEGLTECVWDDVVIGDGVGGDYDISTHVSFGTMLERGRPGGIKL